MICKEEYRDILKRVGKDFFELEKVRILADETITIIEAEEESILIFYDHSL